MSVVSLTLLHCPPVSNFFEGKKKVVDRVSCRSRKLSSGCVTKALPFSQSKTVVDVTTVVITVISRRMIHAVARSVVSTQTLDNVYHLASSYLLSEVECVT